MRFASQCAQALGAGQWFATVYGSPAHGLTHAEFSDGGFGGVESCAGYMRTTAGPHQEDAPDLGRWLD